MKTLDEVVEALNNCADVNANFEACECCEYRDIRDDGYDCGRFQMMEDALYYLKKYQRYQNTPSRNGHMALVDYFEESQKNEPLTWDELKSMEGKPIWVEYNLHIRNKDFRDKSKRWCIVREFKPWHDIEIIITENGFVLSKNEQIKCWQAYRKECS